MALEPGVIDAQWKCKLEKLDGQKRDQAQDQKVTGEITSENPLTVGEVFQLTCEGGNVDLAAEKLSLELPQEAKFALRILKTVDVKATGAQFLATTWSPASVEFPHLYLTDGAKRVDLGPLKIESKSVIPEEKAKEAKPYDPFAPMLMNLPGYVWVFISVVVAVVGLWIAWLIAGVVKRRRLKSLLTKNSITQTPFNFFNKELRRLVRQGTNDSNLYVKELSEAFRWYLTRTFFVNALTMKPAAIVRAVQKKNPALLKPIKRELTLALTELEKALAEKQKLSDADLYQLTELCRSLADRINVEMEA